MLRFDLNGDGFGSGDERDSVMGSEPGGGDGVVEKVGLILCSFVEGNGDSNRLVLQSAP